MIHRLSSKTIPGMAVAVLAMAAMSSSLSYAQGGTGNIEELVSQGDAAYVNNKLDEAVKLYGRAHSMLPNVKASPALQKAVNERYEKAMAMTAGQKGCDVGVVAPSSAAGTSAVQGGVARTGIEQRTIARLNEKIDQSMVSLNKARQLYSEKKYEDSLKEYQAALDVLPEAPVTEKRRQFIIASMGDASVAVAQEYSKVGRYDEARALLDNALKADPNNKFARQALALLDDPVRNNPAKTPQLVADIEEVKRLLLLGYGYYDLGKYDDAVKSFNAALRVDPYNVAARRGIEQVDRRKAAYFEAARNETRGNALNEVDNAWVNQPIDDSVNVDSLASADPLQLKQQTIDDKLKSIVIPSIDFESVDLEEAINYLRRQSEVLDKGQTAADKGVNIIMNLGDADSEKVKEVLGRKFDLKMKNVPLRQAIDYIARASGTISYTTPYAVEFSANVDNVPFVVKTLSVPPGFLNTGEADGADSAAAVDPFADTSSSSGGLSIKRVDPKEALKKMGIPFPEGSFVQFNGANSTLFVRNSPANIRMLEELIAVKASKQPIQVILSATIIEVSEETLKELGFDWIVNLNFNVNKWYGIGAGQPANASQQTPSIAGVPTPVGGLMTGGLRTMSDVATTDTIDSLIRSGAGGNVAGYAPGRAPGIFSLRGVWSQADVGVIMRGLDQQKGVDVLQRPQVIVRPNQQAEFYSGRELIYPEEYEPPQIPTSSGSNSSGNSSNMVVTPAHPTGFVTRKMGTILNVEVVGINDSNTLVSLKLEPEVVEFDGFINYGSPITVPMISYANGLTSSVTGDGGNIQNVEVSKNEILKPVFSTRRETTTIDIETGHTVVFGGLKKAKTVEFEDKVPVFGDIPLVGRLFRSEGKQVERTALIMMVKADIVDPAGRNVATAQPGTVDEANLPLITPLQPEETPAQPAADGEGQGTPVAEPIANVGL